MHEGKKYKDIVREKAEKDGTGVVFVKTPFGTLVAEPSSDGDLYQGIAVYLIAEDPVEGERVDDLVVIEAESLSTENETRLRVLVWGELDDEDYTNEYVVAIMKKG